MSAPDEDPKSQLDDRLKLVREIEERIDNDANREKPLTFWQSTCIAIIGAAVFLTWSVWTGTWKIPRGKENREKAAVFLKQQFPDRELKAPVEESVTAPLAAVFHIIRHGTPNEATAAINFAAEQDFGYASPYVIERLESHHPELRRAARNFLRKMAGRDYGPDADAWKDWWEDGPPRNFLGLVTVDHQTFQLGIPIVTGLSGLLLLLIGTLWTKDFLTALGAALSVLGWFLFICTAGVQFVGSFDTCRFGGEEIVYHQDHGVVEGLEDAKVGGMGLWLLLCLTYVAVPFILAVAILLIHPWLSAKKSKPPNAATS